MYCVMLQHEMLAFLNEKIKLTFVCFKPILPLLDFGTRTLLLFCCITKSMNKCISHTEEKKYFATLFQKKKKKQNHTPPKKNPT